MKILFDQGTPALLRRYLPAHTVDMAYEQCFRRRHAQQFTDRSVAILNYSAKLRP